MVIDKIVKPDKARGFPRLFLLMDGATLAVYAGRGGFQLRTSGVTWFEEGVLRGTGSGGSTLLQSRQASGTTHPLHTLLSHRVKEQHPERYHLTDMKNPTT